MNRKVPKEEKAIDRYPLGDIGPPPRALMNYRGEYIDARCAKRSRYGTLCKCHWNHPGDHIAINPYDPDHPAVWTTASQTQCDKPN